VDRSPVFIFDCNGTVAQQVLALYMVCGFDLSIGIALEQAAKLAEIKMRR
jgi:hypothetical protein